MPFCSPLNRIPRQFHASLSDGGKRLFAPGTFEMLSNWTTEELKKSVDQPDDFEALLEEHATGYIWLISARFIEQKEPPGYIYRAQLLSPYELARLVLSEERLLPQETWARLKAYDCVPEVNVNAAEESFQRQQSWLAASILARLREMTVERKFCLTPPPARVEDLICFLTSKLVDVIHVAGQVETAKSLSTSVKRFHNSVSEAKRMLEVKEPSDRSAIARNLQALLGVEVPEYTDKGRTHAAYLAFQRDVKPALEKLISLKCESGSEPGAQTRIIAKNGWRFCGSFEFAGGGWRRKWNAR